MNKELQELKQQLDEWILKNDPNIYEKDEIEYSESIARLSSYLIVREWVVNKLTKKYN